MESTESNLSFRSRIRVRSKTVERCPPESVVVFVASVAKVTRLGWATALDDAVARNASAAREVATDVILMDLHPA